MNPNPRTTPPDALWQRLRDALLGTDALQRVRLQQSLLALSVMVASALVFLYAAQVAGTAPLAAWIWTVVSLGGMVGMLVAIRAGWSARFEDASLTLPQMLFAITSGAVAYALTGPVRGATLPVLMVALMFGMFQLRPRVVAGAGVYTLALFGAVMWWKSIDEPAVYLADVELGHFLILAATLPAMSLLGARLARLRARSRHQRTALAQALSRIQELATRDELTGLVNRRHMAALLEQERQRGVRSGRPFAVAMVDIDHFKALNEQHGHGVGDEVLRNFARQAPPALRSTDIIGRWGGEQFVLLMPEAATSSARTAIERLRGRIAATPLAHVAGVPVRVTVSAGMSEHIAGEAVTQTLQRADRALADAKAQGRNKTLIA